MAARHASGALFFSIAYSILCCSSADAESHQERSWWEASKEAVTTISDQGVWDIYLSGYAHHSRNTYDKKRIRKLNEKAWGVGLGKTIRNDDGNDESLYVLAIRDSQRNIQLTAGYAYQWIYPAAASSLELGAGIAAAVMHRKDWFDGAPFPAVLPFFSAGTQQAKVMATYVPRVSTRKGKGNVLLLFTKFEF